MDTLAHDLVELEHKIKTLRQFAIKPKSKEEKKLRDHFYRIIDSIIDHVIQNEDEINVFELSRHQLRIAHAQDDFTQIDQTKLSAEARKDISQELLSLNLFLKDEIQKRASIGHAINKHFKKNPIRASSILSKIGVNNRLVHGVVNYLQDKHLEAGKHGEALQKQRLQDKRGLYEAHRISPVTDVKRNQVNIGSTAVGDQPDTEDEQNRGPGSGVNRDNGNGSDQAIGLLKDIKSSLHGIYKVLNTKNRSGAGVQRGGGNIPSTPNFIDPELLELQEKHNNAAIQISTIKNQKNDLKGANPDLLKALEDEIARYEKDLKEAKAGLKKHNKAAALPPSMDSGSSDPEDPSLRPGKGMFEDFREMISIMEKNLEVSQSSNKILTNIASKLTNSGPNELDEDAKIEKEREESGGGEKPPPLPAGLKNEQGSLLQSILNKGGGAEGSKSKGILSSVLEHFGIGGEGGAAGGILSKLGGGIGEIAGPLAELGGAGALGIGASGLGLAGYLGLSKLTSNLTGGKKVISPMMNPFTAPFAIASSLGAGGAGLMRDGWKGAKEGALNAPGGVFMNNPVPSIESSVGGFFSTDTTKDAAPGTPSIKRDPSLLPKMNQPDPLKNGSLQQKSIAQVPQTPPSSKNGIEELGSTSRAHESGADGAGAINEKLMSQGLDKYGGYSYGLYQFSTKQGVMGQFLSYVDKLSASDPEVKQIADKLNQAGGIKGATEGSKSFKDAWKSFKSSKKMADIQQAFAKKEFYQPVVENLKKAGLDISNRSIQLKNAVFELGIGGSGNAQKIITKIKDLHNGDLSKVSDKEIMEQIYIGLSNAYGGTKARESVKATGAKSQALKSESSALSGRFLKQYQTSSAELDQQDKPQTNTAVASMTTPNRPSVTPTVSAQSINSQAVSFTQKASQTSEMASNSMPAKSTSEAQNGSGSGGNVIVSSPTTNVSNNSIAMGMLPRSSESTFQTMSQSSFVRT